MTKFKMLMIPVLAAATATVALPAAAQSYRHGPAPAYQQHHGGWQAISQRKYNLDRRIDQGIRTGQLSRREATRLTNELNSLVRLERSYMRDGLNRRERQELDRRYDALSAKIRYERRDHDNRRW